MSLALSRSLHLSLSACVCLQPISAPLGEDENHWKMQRYMTYILPRQTRSGGCVLPNRTDVETGEVFRKKGQGFPVTPDLVHRAHQKGRAGLRAHSPRSLPHSVGATHLRARSINSFHAQLAFQASHPCASPVASTSEGPGSG